jgi:hypothetical protein
MKKQTIKFKIKFSIPILGLLILCSVQDTFAQRIKWLAITQLQSQINEIGAEYELEFAQGSILNFFSWPVQYGIGQTTCRMNAVWIGCKNFDDPVEGNIKSVKVIGSGPRNPLDRPNEIFEQDLKLIGKSNHPMVIVDNQNASAIDSYDKLDVVDPNLEADRIVQVKFNTSIGVSVTKKVMAFDSPYHDSYFIYDYVFKNTGIYDRAGDVKQQILTNVYFYWMYRNAFAGVTSGGPVTTWGAAGSTWGNSTLNHAFGENPLAPGFDMRGFYSYYSPVPNRASSYDADWGCPDIAGDGTLGSSMYEGCATLHADKSATDSTDDLNQPKTTWYIGSDINIMQQNVSQYNESFMQDRYDCMSEGHPLQQHDDMIFAKYQYAMDYSDPRRQTGGGVSQGQGYGPYTIPFGDSIHIVFVQGVNGLSWEKAREIGSNWLQWYQKSSTAPKLVMPDGSNTTDFNAYKKAWCFTGKDSIMQMYHHALRNYNLGYKIPHPPPPPQQFTVTSGGDRISLSWSNNAENSPHFDGYVIYRSQGSALDWKSVYEKIFECNKSNVVHSFDDVTALRGFDYYYYIQSKDDGTQNDIASGVPLTSSLFWTVTNVPATLQRPAVTAPPKEPVADTVNWKPIAAVPEVWDSTVTKYNAYTTVTYRGTEYVCISDTGMGGSTTGKNSHAIFPDTSRYWKPVVPKGVWVFGSAYRKYNSVTDKGAEYVCIHDIAAGSMLEQVRVVPNPYDIRARLYQFNAAASGPANDHDRIAFFQLPPKCKLIVFTERGDRIWEKDHTNGTGDQLYNSETISGQILASGIYLLYVEVPGGGSVIRKFVVIR